jgi:polyribonucleotide nucleotidyltransferase
MNQMFDIVKKEIQWGEETLTLETGKVARQADGTVIATLGETSVMANVTFAKQQKEGQDFFPLTVHYQEKYYAAGKVPGGFFKREARPTEKETLTARLIDRPIRPLFVPGFKNEVLVMCTVLSHDLVNDPDIVAMIAASAALTSRARPLWDPSRAPAWALRMASISSTPRLTTCRGCGTTPSSGSTWLWPAPKTP